MGAHLAVLSDHGLYAVIDIQQVVMGVHEDILSNVGDVGKVCG